jgi:hypothetical protein
VLAALFVVIFIALSSVGVLLSRSRVHRLFVEEEGWREHVMITLEGAFVFFGLLLALVTIAVYGNYTDARARVSGEAAELSALYRDVSGYPQPLRGELQGRIREYTEYVVREAWPQQARGLVPRGGVARITALQELLYSYEPASPGQNVLHETTLLKYNDFAKARRERLHAVTVALPAALWWVLICGALINIGLSCLLPVKSTAGHLLLSGAFATVIALILFVTAAMDHPFRGSFSVGPEAFETILHDVMGDTKVEAAGMEAD